MPSTVRLRGRVTVLLQDQGTATDSSATLLTTAEVDSCIREAVYEYSSDRPRNLSLLADGTGSDISVASGAINTALLAWDGPQSFIRWIEYPINSTGDPDILRPGSDFILYPEGDSAPTVIRFLATVPSTGTSNVRIAYRDLHVYMFPPTDVVVGQAGTAGATTYSYVVTATDSSGETLESNTATISTGNASLDLSNYNTITWEPVFGATGYVVYRTVGPTTGKVGTTTAPTVTLNDVGIVDASSSAPSSDSTATTVEQRHIEPVSRLSVAHCIGAMADKLAAFRNEDFNGDVTNFESMMERYAARASAAREYYRMRMSRPAEDLRAAGSAKTLWLPSSKGGRFLDDAYNRRNVVR